MMIFWLYLKNCPECCLCFIGAESLRRLDCIRQNAAPRLMPLRQPDQLNGHGTVLFRFPGASEKSLNNVELRQISYNHSLGDLARVSFTIGDICAWLTENRFAWRLGSRFVHNWRHLRPANGKVPMGLTALDNRLTFEPHRLKSRSWCTLLKRCQISKARRCPLRFMSFKSPKLNAGNTCIGKPKVYGIQPFLPTYDRQLFVAKSKMAWRCKNQSLGAQ
ncbi:hypothetical protein AVEN_52114-1 [Araneus ventricosus]|uniref:Uncharacterized protein n=1 Tax=Araneus ventricosus TaxID=182803 RepID=A0A4Y2N2E2_ARAVE|nr:hypothetical protein AVEN_52114-1 [Araneus ventricosus]